MTTCAATDLPILDFVVADEPDNAAPALARLLIDLSRRAQDAAAMEDDNVER
jgi:hypothetical protein